MPQYIITEEDILKMEPGTREYFLDFIQEQQNSLLRRSKKANFETPDYAPAYHPNEFENVALETMVTILGGLGSGSLDIISAIVNKKNTKAELEKIAGRGLPGTVGSINRRFRKRFTTRYSEIDLQNIQFLRWTHSLVHDKLVKSKSVIPSLAGALSADCRLEFCDGFSERSSTIAIALAIISAGYRTSDPTPPVLKHSFDEINQPPELLQLDENALISSEGDCHVVLTVGLDDKIEDISKVDHTKQEFSQKVLRPITACHAIVKEGAIEHLYRLPSPLAFDPTETSVSGIEMGSIEVLLGKEARAALKQRRKSDKAHLSKS